MSSPLACTPTALLLDLSPSNLCGIDLLSFTTTAAFHGIKDIPPGWHLIFTSETTSLSIREGFWFHVPHAPQFETPALIVRRWDTETGSLRPVREPQSYSAQLPQLWEKNLSPYRQSASRETTTENGDWAGLTRHVSLAGLKHLTQGEDLRITSASSATEDRDDIPGLTHEEVGEEHELGTLGIDLKRTWKEGAVGRERTEGALDRSWALNDVVDRWNADLGVEDSMWGGLVLGQMEACFLLVLTVANYSCLEEWKRCICLALTCKRAVRDKQEWFIVFLGVLRRQLERCEDVEGGLFDMSDDGGGLLKELLKEFKRTLGHVFGINEGEDVKEEMGALEAFLKQEYGWELGDEFVRKGMVQLADGEMVEMETAEMEGEDERGEYAPMIVDLGDQSQLQN